MSEFIRKPRNVLLTMSVLLLAMACTLASWHLTSKRAHATMMQPLDATALLCALTSADVAVDSLAAAGLTSYDVQQLVTNSHSYMQGDDAQLVALQQERSRYRNNVDSLRRRIRAGIATVDEIDAYDQLSRGLTQAESALSDYLDGLFDAATANLSVAQHECLATIRTNASWRSIDAREFLAIEHTEAEWVELREALANERIANADGEYPDAQAQATLTMARTDPDVSSAATNHYAYYPSVKQAWDTALMQ